ncbi:hypothetical protein AZ021_004533 [Enterobacter ludwigii]|nr:transposase [Enterobacter ludwigii]OUF04868.1 hypothetical protein AZ021_004533 [Enterobacter ludwigii]HDT1289570.1 transposase [Enterobacter asburiae]
MDLKIVGLTTACALVACISNDQDLKNRRNLEIWLELKPSQYSNGGKLTLGRIMKAGENTSDSGGSFR